MAFIDGTNLFQAVKAARRSDERYRIDLELLKNALGDPCRFGNPLVSGVELDVVRTYFYDAIPSRGGLPVERKGFLDKLRFIGIKPVTLPLKMVSTMTAGEALSKFDDAEMRGGPPAERLADTRTGIAMSLDILEFAYRGAYDVCLVVSHDDDFCDAIRRIMETGHKVYVVAFAGRLGELRHTCDAVLDLEQVRDEIRLAETRA